MKQVIFFIIVMFHYGPTYSQCLVCTDSTYYARLDTILDNHVSEYAIMQGVYVKDADDWCNMKRFAYLVDRLFSRGLNLHAKLVPGVRDNTIIIGIVLPEEKPEKIVYDKTSLYLSFIAIKSVYEKKFYNKNNNPEYTSTIDALVKYGAFSYPQNVKDFLSNNYRQFTKEKFYKDMRDATKNK